MKRLILFLFLVLSTNVLAEEKKITADELKDTTKNIERNWGGKKQSCDWRSWKKLMRLIFL